MNSTESTGDASHPEMRHRHCHGGRKKWLKIPFVIAAVVLLKSWVVMFLWNEVIPDLFHVSMITYLQAIELTILAKVLLGFGGHGMMMGRMMRHRRHGHHRFSRLSPEERERLKAEIKNRC